MVTNLKKSKKIRAFCYRMIAVGALITAIITGFMGREVLVNTFYQGVSAPTKDIYYFTEFREYVSKLYNKAMIAYAGIGDDMGYPLTHAHAGLYSGEARQEFNDMVETLGDDILYYIMTPDGMEHTNTDYPLFSEYDGHLLLPEDVRLCCYWDGPGESYTLFGTTTATSYNLAARYYEAQYQPNKDNAAKMKLVLAVKDNYGSSVLRQMAWKADRIQSVLITFSVSSITWIIFAILSLFTRKAAAQAKEDFAKISIKIWLEPKLILTALIIWIVYFYHLYDLTNKLAVRMKFYGNIWLCFPLGCLLYLLYTDIKQNKGKVVVTSLPGKCILNIKDFIYSKPWYRRASMLSASMVFSGAVLIICGLLLIANGTGILPITGIYARQKTQTFMTVCSIVMLPAGLLLFFCYIKQTKLLKDTAAIVDKLSKMKNGAINVPLQLSKNSLITNAANDLNELESGIEKAVEEQSRSNKMRVELLTNVSHDLKTPLTSIINYADLLCEEELPETAAEYATALQSKAYRLKNMVQDVFDLSKATSGNLPVEKTVIDLVKLIKQTLADMDERIQESDLTFKLNISTEPLFIDADGEKLYRVFQNLFVNALQYSLEHSRVHVQLTEENGFAVAKVKNTSRMELNFDPSEIVERFVRADSARTTEGSGLGLSIVQSFVEACGGEFLVETDADMFTACVRFPLAERPLVAEKTFIEEDPVMTEEPPNELSN